MSLEIEKPRFIPYTRSDLKRLLLAQETLSTTDRDQFKVVCELLTHLYHAQFHDSLETLKASYAPVNPDSDTLRPFTFSADETAAQEEQLFESLDALLNKANFEQITREDLHRSMSESLCFKLN
jgi:hypothetical protein